MQMAPYIIDNFLSPEQCKQIIDLGADHKRIQAGIQNKLVRDWKRVNDIVSDEGTALQNLVQMVHKDVGEKIKELYKSDVVVPRDVGYFYEYGMGDFYLPHCDSQTVYSAVGEQTIAIRKTSSSDISSVVYLNDNFLGGEFEFVFAKHKIKPKTGTLLLFYGGWQNAHAVNPIQVGKRYCIVNWYATDPLIVPKMEVVPSPYAEQFAEWQDKYQKATKGQAETSK